MLHQEGFVPFHQVHQLHTVLHKKEEQILLPILHIRYRNHEDVLSSDPRIGRRDNISNRIISCIDNSVLFFLLQLFNHLQSIKFLLSQSKCLFIHSHLQEYIVTNENILPFLTILATWIPNDCSATPPSALYRRVSVSSIITSIQTAYLSSLLLYHTFI
ncbi:hypothetical protein PRIPAC_83643 [Pristionchus pacificus]|uniref:Uncharacterized protein n=1 Tax=Pristionchus pacificus TaxID=54126 RepID=A0A2A6BLW2_PRIPA|nr:hypothetical protein PRIPAC_83643 [Pristionchus pacificus]|eukprot:PDM66793.1 hypothetical protein PRIPAC_48210 [Pristionchus pacificus]